MFSRDHRYSVNHSTSSKVWALKIQGVKPSDQGEYQCQAATSTGVRTNSYWLYVRQPMVNILGSTVKHVSLGDSIIMTCELRDSALQPDYLSWYHNSELISNISGLTFRSTLTKRPPSSLPFSTTVTLISKLKIRATKLDHSGNYSCGSSNFSSEDIILFVSTGI